MAISEPFVLPDLHINKEFTWGPPEEEMTIDGELFTLYRKPDRSDRNDKPALPAFDFFSLMRYDQDNEVGGAKGKFTVVENTQRLNTIASAKSKQTNRSRYPNQRFDPNRRKNNRTARRIIAHLPNTISIPSTCTPLTEFTQEQLSKLPEVVPLVEDIGTYSLPLLFNYDIEKKISEKPVTIDEENMDYRSAYVMRPDTLSDPVIQEFMKQANPKIPCIGITDELLSLLLVANNAVHPWHLKVSRSGHFFIIYRSEREDNVEKQWVSENGTSEFAPSEDNQNESERISSLGEESTKVHESFIRMCCTKTRAKMSTNKNPFPQTQPRVYRYRRFTFHAGTADEYNLIVRCEADAVGKNNELIRLFGLLEQENTNRERWAHRIKRKISASIIPDEFRSNTSKMSRWIVLSILADVSMMKIGLISRRGITSSPFGGDVTYTPDSHCLHHIESIPPPNLARQLNINLRGMWATANLILSSIISKMTDEDAVIVKQNNRQLKVVEGIDSDGSDEEDDDDDEEDDEDDEEDDEDDE